MPAMEMTTDLILGDGTIFRGQGFGAPANAEGEVVFNTGMIGYPECMTDPSYSGQILVMSYPLVGNYGVPGYDTADGLSKHFESDRIHVRGLVVANICHEPSHWNCVRSLPRWMEEQGIAGLSGVDTRALTRKLREEGTMSGRLVHSAPGDVYPKGRADAGLRTDDPVSCATTINVDGADGPGEPAGEWGEDTSGLVPGVSVKEPVFYERGKRRVVLVDCGVKHSIIRSFLRRDISVLRVPWDHDPAAEEADGIVLSNGPGDPMDCRSTVENARGALEKGRPILGICLGSQILGLAAGASTYKLPYGHRSHNQPCLEVGTRNRCYITSQNHGYAVDADTLPEDWREWFYNNNDGTNEGIIHISKPFFGAQFHPEASPGPDDTEFIFDMFVRALR